MYFKVFLETVGIGELHPAEIAVKAWIVFHAVDIALVIRKGRMSKIFSPTNVANIRLTASVYVHVAPQLSSYNESLFADSTVK